MKKILIVNRTQFGYNIDSLKYCQYLKDEFDVTYFCLDTGKIKVKEEGVNIVYITQKGGYLARGFSFFRGTYEHINKNNFDLILLFYFPITFLLKVLLPKELFVFDIRTGSISKYFFKRNIYNIRMRIEAMFFNNITIISECLRDNLMLNSKYTHILPLGSDILSEMKKDFSIFKLLYVGTFTNRNIHETVIGLAYFLKKNNIAATYDIFGDGLEEDTKMLLDAIEKYNLSSVVTLHGRKLHEEIKPYYDRCNLGISYVPMTEYYDCQPPTKTYEYANAGLLCIATKTSENKKLINKQNGILCEDTPESFCAALETYNKNKKQYDSHCISESLKSYTWKNIVNKNLKTYILNKIEH